MIGTSLLELIFIRISIIFLRLVAPLSLIYLAAEYWRGTFNFASPLVLYAILEFAFFALVYLPRRRYLQKPAIHPVLTRELCKELLRRCNDPLTSEDVDAPSAWFNFIPLSLVNQDNFVEWLYWAMFCSTVLVCTELQIACDRKVCTQYQECSRFSDRDLVMRFRGGGVDHKSTREATDFFKKDRDRLDVPRQTKIDDEEDSDEWKEIEDDDEDSWLHYGLRRVG